MYHYATLTTRRCKFTRNVAGLGGGALYLYYAKLIAHETEFTDNEGPEVRGTGRKLACVCMRVG